MLRALKRRGRPTCASALASCIASHPAALSVSQAPSPTRLPACRMQEVESQRKAETWKSSISIATEAATYSRIRASAKLGRGPHGVAAAAPRAKYAPHSPPSASQPPPARGRS